MRILFTTLPMLGHFHPLIPIARAAQRAGHTIAFASAASFSPTIEAAGFQAIPAGYSPPELNIPKLFPGHATIAERDGSAWTVPNIFAGVLAPVMATDLLAVCATWLPDLLVRDAAEYGGCAAAETLGLPHASVRTGALASSYARRALVHEPLARLRVVQGLPPDPETTMPFRYLHLACEPPGFTDPTDALGPTTHLLRPMDANAHMTQPLDHPHPRDAQPDAQPLPAWLATLPTDRPIVYATLGTVASDRPSGRAAFATILAALRDEPLTLILTVGRANDPAQFGPQPPHIHIERYIPQEALLPHCDLVIHQAGFSTVIGALNAGLPMALLPIGADQPLNAARCVALGVGLELGPDERTPAALRAIVRTLLTDPTYRHNAQRLRAASAALPGPERAVALLERLATERRPLLAPPDATLSPQ